MLKQLCHTRFSRLKQPQLCVCQLVTRYRGSSTSLPPEPRNRQIRLWYFSGILHGRKTSEGLPRDIRPIVAYTGLISPRARYFCPVGAVVLQGGAISTCTWGKRGDFCPIVKKRISHLVLMLTSKATATPVRSIDEIAIEDSGLPAWEHFGNGEAAEGDVWHGCLLLVDTYC